MAELTGVFMSPRDNRKGLARPEIRHIQYVWRQANSRAYGHHELTTHAEPDLVYQCGICDRWIVRGRGRWWL